MKIIQFLKLAEIQTKVASMTPLFVATFYTLYYYEIFDLKNFVLIFVSLLCFDMATTVLNNYYDYVKALKTEGYGYEDHNAIVKYNLSASTVRKTLLVLLVTAISTGMALFINTHPLTLLIGCGAFLVGIFYSFGPVPISRTPLGEIFSGFVMGFFITFLGVFIHIHEFDPVSFGFDTRFLTMNLDMDFLARIIIVSWPSIIGIGNIMLANNICDIEEDIENKRYTLPIYIGKKKALWIFENSYYTAYVAVLMGVFSETLPLLSLLMFPTIKLLRKNIAAFKKLQTKKDTFSLSIKNFLLLDGSLLLTLLVSLILDKFI
ncbi:1,4-dihydroxy-2-naphthoate polyprenyltransferase [Alkalibacter mobilis]|uniref:1,4-dihydroxy-2-naphthoate polyprenyltransferase n=1 Tax=Alkalibacter mobilis TaxID=2787712 RepID=UPI00189FE3D6|nr:1,4-dihydroxy-2-naphthoate polyprenyltransferase [Alkalibacter mobilis]MBF7096360.1 1,4-dihydroxy-2-naphthoate polyprenyltransferase [Alkalibacter mobilis]